MTLGQTISYLRERRGLSQSALAKQLKIGTSTLGMWETDKRKPNPDALLLIADFFNVTTDYLLGRNQTPEWANKKDAQDLEEFMRINEGSMTYGGEDLTEEETQRLKIAMQQVFWNRHKHD